MKLRVQCVHHPLRWWLRAQRLGCHRALPRTARFCVWGLSGGNVCAVPGGADPTSVIPDHVEAPVMRRLRAPPLRPPATCAPQRLSGCVDGLRGEADRSHGGACRHHRGRPARPQGRAPGGLTLWATAPQHRPHSMRGAGKRPPGRGEEGFTGSKQREFQQSRFR